MSNVFSVATEADLDAAIVAIDVGGTASAADTAYVIQITTDLSLTTDIPAITLASGDTLSIQGDNADNTDLSATIDGGGSRGFVINSGSVSFSELSLVAMTAPGGTGGAPGGGGALYVANGATVSTTAVNFSGDSASGGTPAGGAVFIAQGGTFSVSGGTIAGSGKATGNGIFIQGNNTVTLINTTITGAIADQTGALLGTGSGSLITEGTVTLGGASTYTGGTLIDSSLTLTAAGAAGSGAITFGATTGDTLAITAGAPANLIDGFVVPTGATSNVIDLQAIGLAATDKLLSGNHLEVFGSTATVTLNLDPAQNYANDTFVLAPDAGTGTAVTVAQTSFAVANEADLNAALLLIDRGGLSAAPNITYTITFTAGFTLTTDLDAIDLASGSVVTIDGAGFTLDGAHTYRGFFDYAGGLTLENLTIQDAVATGGTGGAGAAPGGGGAGLGGGLFVASGGAATLSNVTFLDDEATGGGGGQTGGVGSGGGGGLGGAGGAGGAGTGGARNGGGGGIGLGATGGSASGGPISGGGGIIIGAPGGKSGTGNDPAGGGGGANGGGGGGAGTIRTAGSGRDPVSHYAPGLAGSGGVSGSFGGGAAGGGPAGFGGGGANSAGGWGGGGSAGQAGGFGGGASGGGGAGGGLGAGGGVFVQQGGSLTFLAGTESGSAATGGSGSGASGSGSGLGSGLFIQGQNDLTFAPSSGQTVSIADTIADEASAGGTGVGGLIMNGAGTLTLSASNTFTGGTRLAGNGTLSLQAPGAAGTGPITFAYGTADELVIGSGDVPANIISDFLPGDTIDLQGIGTATTTTPGSGDILTISGGTKTVQLSLDPAQNFTGETFHVATDQAGGTLLTATDIANDFPPSIVGTGTIAGDDHTALDPLAGVTVSDLDVGQTETVTLTLSSTLNGTLSNLAGGNYDASTGVYTVIGKAASVTAALDGLVFTPTNHEAAPGNVVTTQFNLSATDGLMTSIATATTVNITALNDAPVIAGLPPSYVEGYWNAPFNPFPAATITDPDLGATETVTLGLSSNLSGAPNNGGTLSLSMPGVTLTSTGVGTYSLSAGSPTLITAALDALQFTPAPNPSVAGYTITYIGMSVSDGIAAPVTSQVQVLAGLPIFAGTAANQSVNDGSTIKPFSTVGVTDSAGLTIQGMTVTLYDSSSGFATPTDANGTLSGPDLIKAGVGIYTVTPGSTTAVSAELDALVFTPTTNASPVTTDFVLSAFDGATTADNSDTSVTATPLCFCEGTLIATPDAEVPVQQLSVGDLVLTQHGEARPIVWIGVGSALITDKHCAATPVIVHRGALADNVPHRDLRVTKGHAFHLDGVLVPVEFLVNHRSIVWDDRPREIALYHLELPSHDVLLANGAPAESYRDDGNRWLFRNANSGWGLPEQQPCAPLLTGGPIVDALWRRLLDRAGGPSSIRTTGEPDLHLVVDGTRIDARRTSQSTYLFRLPPHAVDVRLVSRVGAPCELGVGRDPRPLGVALRRVQVWQGARLRLMEASDPLLDDGFHSFEADNGFRWTSGAARLPATLFDGVTGPSDLELHVAATAQYPLFSEAASHKAA